MLHQAHYRRKKLLKVSRKHHSIRKKLQDLEQRRQHLQAKLAMCERKRNLLHQCQLDILDSEDDADDADADELSKDEDKSVNKSNINISSPSTPQNSIFQVTYHEIDENRKCNCDCVHCTMSSVVMIEIFDQSGPVRKQRYHYFCRYHFDSVADDVVHYAMTTNEAALEAILTPTTLTSTTDSFELPSPIYNPTTPSVPYSPVYNPTTPTVPKSPNYAPNSPIYNPTTPTVPKSPNYAPNSPTFVPPKEPYDCCDLTAYV